MSANSLCFKEAFDARERGEINHDEYLMHLVAHFGELRHPADAEGKRPYVPSYFNRTVRDLALSEKLEPLDGTSNYANAIKEDCVEELC